MFELWFLGFVAVVNLTASLMVSTTDNKSAFVFNVIPFIIGAGAVFLFLQKLGFIVQV